MLLYTTFTLECAHRVSADLGEPQIHGHSYWVQVFVASSSAAPYPLHELELHAERAKSLLDHRLLNDVIDGDPTQEAIIEFIRHSWTGPALQKIIVRRDSIHSGAEWAAG